MKLEEMFKNDITSKRKNLIIILILIGIIIISFSFMAIRKNETQSNKIARVYQNGVIVKEIKLDTLTEPIEFDVIGDNGKVNTIRAEKGRVCMLHADCPDKICVNQGWIDSGIVPIVCLPNKVTIEISGGTESDLDGDV